MPQPILGIKGTAEYVEASGSGTVESPYIPTVYVANPGSGGGGGISGTVSITGTLPSFATTQTFNIGTAPNLTFTNTSFTANAGTNLNTSLLALESGGNLAGINIKLPSSLGPKTAATSFPVTLSSDGAFATAFGGASDAAATNDTANTGYLSLFKRFLQRTANWGLSATPWFTKSNTYFQTYTITKREEIVAYIAGDVYGTLFELADFGVANGSFFLVGVNLVSSLSQLPPGMGLFSLFLFDSMPPSIADNAAFALASSSITPQGIPLNPLSLIANATQVTSQTSQINELFRRGSSSTLYAYLVTQSGFTPANATANTMTITLKAIEA